MKYCPNCGKSGVEGMKFCPRCGQKLTGPNLEDKQRSIPKPEAPLKEKSWFERHLNWTMVLTWLSTYLISFVVGFVGVLINPDISEDTLIGIAVIISLIVTIAVGQWVLRKKNRSLAWLLICWTWFFLLIENHSFPRDELGRTAADYDKLIELDPSNADAYHERGDFYYEMDQYGKAIADYNKAIELNPNHADAYYNRGCAYGEIGEYEKAIADYNKAIELDPNDANAYYNRGVAYREKGEVPKAVSDLEKCIGLSTDHELTEAAQQALSEIKKSPRGEDGMSKKTKILFITLIVLLIGAVLILINQQLAIAPLKSRLATLENETALYQQQITDYEEEIGDLESELQRYRDTGIRVYDGRDLPRILKYMDLDWSRVWEDSDYVSLVNNTNAVNPTFDQLMSFLEQDDTDTYYYREDILSGRICGWFAERVHNNAEQAGIKAAFVSVNFAGETTGHALDAFNTIDKGLVFIDCTGEEFEIKPIPFPDPWTITYEIGDTGSHDTIAYIEKDKPIGWININMPYGLEYSEYERWRSDVDAMKYRFDKADSHAELSQIVTESNNTLGSFFEPSDEIVESIEIYW